jgi:hypothetical protein
LALLLDLAEQQLKLFSTHPAKAKGWLSAGLYKTDKNINVPLLASYTVVASTIINSDAAITKR